MRLVLLLALATGLVPGGRLLCQESPADAVRGGPSPRAADLYALHCSPCHGERGRGDGPAARFLEPTPRDFQLGSFRLISTSNGIPSDRDLFEAISAGLPGTAMLGFAHLPAEDRWGLVSVLRDFRREGLRSLYRPLASSAAELEEWVEAETSPGPPILVPPDTPDTVDSRARGRIHFRTLCAACHAPDGRGLELPDRVTAEGDAARPRDLTRGVLRGGTLPPSLFTRIRAGMPGTPMPSVPASTLDDSGVWDLVHFLGTLIPRGSQELHDPLGWDISVPRMEGPLPQAADDPRFLAAPEVHVALAPFRSQEATIPGLLVRALHDGRHLIFLMTCPDPTRDIPAPDHRTPPDGLAIRITQLQNPSVLPTPGLPLPLDRALFTSGPMPAAEDPLFDGVKPRFTNPDSVCKSPIGPEKVGRGLWRDGVWRVVMAITPDRAGEIRPGQSMSVSFAAFDGAQRLGPLPVAFSAWHRLVLAP